MVNRTRYYNLPGTQKLTANVDEYIKAWNDMAAPIEKQFDLKLHGFDPTFSFIKGNQQGQHTVVQLPVWFVRQLSEFVNAKDGTSTLS